MARMDAEASRPIDDPAPIRDFPKYGRPLVYVSGIYGKAVAWTHTYEVLVLVAEVSGAPQLSCPVDAEGICLAEVTPSPIRGNLFGAQWYLAPVGPVGPDSRVQ